MFLDNSVSGSGTVTAFAPSPFTATTIVVSGYPGIVSVSFLMYGSRVSVQSGGHETLLASPPQPRPPLQFRQVWCASCRGLVPAASARDERLGFRGYCLKCVVELAARCERENRRLPGEGEFFCLSCPPGTAIRPQASLCTPERDGRRRLRCKGCRLRQLRERRQQRRAQAVAALRRSTHHSRSSRPRRRYRVGR